RELLETDNERTIIHEAVMLRAISGRKEEEVRPEIQRCHYDHPENEPLLRSAATPDANERPEGNHVQHDGDTMLDRPFILCGPYRSNCLHYHAAKKLKEHEMRGATCACFVTKERGDTNSGDAKRHHA